MEIEVIGNYRIKCTLTDEYLKSRWIDIGDLSYGTQAASDLFRDIMEEAKDRFGIDFKSGDNRPIMIEAVPMGENSLVVFISKTEEAEEIDIRFSRFTPGSGTGKDEDDELDLFSDDDEDGPVPVSSSSNTNKPVPKKNVSEYGRSLFDITAGEMDSVRDSGCLITISFDKPGDMMDFADSAAGFEGENSLYKSKTGKYLLVIPASGEVFSKAVSLAGLGAEFGSSRIVPRSGAGFLDKGFELIIAGNAIEKLGK